MPPFSMDTENTSDIENIPLSPLKANEKDDTEASETICWSPRFEFDAPRYANFSSKKYRETAKLLNKLVLNREDGMNEKDYNENEPDSNNDNKKNTELNDQDGIDDLDIYDSLSDDSSEIDEWFHRFHPLHEPLRPMTPPGPLISPERSFNASFKSAASLKASPLKLDLELNTPSKGPNTRIGLRSKPARVLKGSSSTTTSMTTDNRYYNTSGTSSPSSLIRTDFTNNLTVRNTSSPVRLHSPIRNNLNFSSPIKQTNSNSILTPTRLSINSTASSITLSVSSLTKTFYSTDNQHEPTSPLKMKTKFSEGTASPLRKAVGILQIQEIDAVKGSKKRTTENEKKSSEPKKSKSMNAELEDIKKLLSQHNNRIRPNNNKKR